jgi:hypothetical protein
MIVETAASARTGVDLVVPATNVGSAPKAAPPARVLQDNFEQ